MTSQVAPNLSTFDVNSIGAKGDIPLTTIFTPPPSCLSTVTYDGTTFWQGGLLQTGDQDCYPPHFTDIFDSQYTPGICPHGWTSVGNPNGVGPITQPDGDLASKAFCCPSGYYHSSTDVGFLQNACASLFGSPLTNVYVTDTRVEGPIPADAQLTTISPEDVNANTVYADIIQIQWASTDLDVIRLMSETSSSSSSTATSMSSSPPQTAAGVTAPGPSSTSSPSPSPTSTPTPTPGGLSTGAEAGIGIGVALGAVVFALLAYYLWRRRRESTPVDGGNGISSPGYRVAHELNPKYEKNQPTELPSQQAAELPGDDGRAELAPDTAKRRSIFSRTTSTTTSPASGHPNAGFGGRMV